MQHCQMIQAGDIQAIVGDDARDGVGGTQYSGLWSLTSKHRVFNAFGNSYAGLLAGDLRRRGCRIEVVDDTTVAVVHDADANYPSSARGLYTVRAPHYIDHSLTIRDKEPRFVLDTPTPYREVSWCCYTNSPEDPRIHMRSNGEWFRYISPKHGHGSSIAPGYVPEAQLPVFRQQDEKREPFHVDRIDRRFDEPFYYGRLGNMVLILVFDTPRRLHFYCSPTGGGGSILPGKACPAWDFEWLIPESDYAVGRDYAFRLRAIYKRFVSDDDVLDEVKRTQDDLGFEKV